MSTYGLLRNPHRLSCLAVFALCMTAVSPKVCGESNPAPLRFLTLNVWGDYFENPVAEREASMETAILRDAPDVVVVAADDHAV